MKTKPINNLIVVSDLHCGCRLGLCPPKVQLDDGAIYSHTPIQADIWKRWVEFWEVWVPQVTRGEPFIVVLNGDSIDGVHHKAVTQISHNLTDQARIAKIILRPVVEACHGRYYQLRGTESHGGPSGQEEERLAEELNAIPDKQGRYARWELWIEIGVGLVHLTHHIGTAGSLAYETTAVHKELEQSFVEAARWGDRHPDVIVRCLSEDTELLTQNGWKGIDDVQVGDPVLTFHPLSQQVVWQEATDKVINEYEPEMVRMTGKGTDMLVTPDHNMIVRVASGRWGAGGWKNMPASELLNGRFGPSKNGAHLEVPVSGWYEGTPVDLTHAQLWLIGFFMADGSFVRQPDRRRYAARVHQSASEVEVVEMALRKAGIDTFTSCINARKGDTHFDHRHSRFIYTRKDCLSWYIPTQHSSLFIANLDDNKSLLPHMLDMTAEQFSYLLAGFKYGDGAKSSMRLFNINERILDQLQELFVKHGYKSSLRWNEYYTTKRNERKRGGVLNYIPGCPAAGIGQKKRHQISLVPYGGRSWCVSVPNKTLVTRRNGCVVIIGNSHRHRNVETRIQTAHGFATACTTAGWQGKTPFVFKIVGGRQTLPQIGGTLVRSGDEDVYTRHRLWNLNRPQTEKPRV